MLGYQWRFCDGPLTAFATAFGGLAGDAVDAETIASV